MTEAEFIEQGRIAALAEWRAKARKAEAEAEAAEVVLSMLREGRDVIYITHTTPPKAKA